MQPYTAPPVSPSAFQYLRDIRRLFSAWIWVSKEELVCILESVNEIGIIARVSGDFVGLLA